MHLCVQCYHILRFLKYITQSHLPDRYVVCVQKGIKIDLVVWPLTQSFSQSSTQLLTGLSLIICKIFTLLPDPQIWQHCKHKCIIQFLLKNYAFTFDARSHIVSSTFFWLYCSFIFTKHGNTAQKMVFKNTRFTKSKRARFLSLKAPKVHGTGGSHGVEDTRHMCV